jgi:hypothetical protein
MDGDAHERVRGRVRVVHVHVDRVHLAVRVFGRLGAARAQHVLRKRAKPLACVRARRGGIALRPTLRLSRGLAPTGAAHGKRT